MIIDTHTHIYSPDEKYYPPAEEILAFGWTGKATRTPKRPPGPASIESLGEEIRSNGVRAACIVQTSTFYRFDNRYICDSARRNPGWAAGVCTMDPDDPYSASTLAHDAKLCGLRGIRSIAGSDGTLDSPNVRALWKTAAELGLVVNVLISWTDEQGGWYWGKDHLPGLENMLKQFSELPVVIDHCLDMKAGRPETPQAVAAMLRVSRYKNVHAKLSWVASGSQQKYPCRDAHPICLQLISAFGPERCVWGSSYPSALWAPKLSYAEHLRIFTHELDLNETARAELVGGTAKRLWFPALSPSMQA
jgi:predicted TIM-barrel fold metal-dependent hydrolase